MKLNYAIFGDGSQTLALFWCKNFAQKLPGTMEQIESAIAHYKAFGYELEERSPSDAPVDTDIPKARAPRPLKGAQQVLAIAQ